MPISTLFSKKKKLGFSKKHRTKEEIDMEYSHNAGMYGHYTRMAKQDADKYQDILDHHMNEMLRLNKERTELPPEPPKTPETKVEEEKKETA